MSKSYIESLGFHRGMAVDVSFDNNFGMPTLGFVWQVKNEMAVIQLQTVDRGPVCIRFCRYRHDPYLKEHPEWVSPEHAIFDFNELEKQRLEDRRKVDELYKIVTQLAADTVADKKPAADLNTDPQEASRSYGRGRAKSIREPVEAM